MALVPLLLVSAFAVAQALTAGWALLSAGEAARAAARAAHVGGDAEDAAGRALPGLLEPAEVNADGSEVRIEVRVPSVLPGVPRIPVAASAALDPGAAP